jgi:hypothetical protein
MLGRKKNKGSVGGRAWRGRLARDAGQLDPPQAALQPAFWGAWIGPDWCYWGAIRFVIWCGVVRSAAGNELSKRA